MSEFIMPKMTEINFRLKRDDYFYRLRCAREIKKVMELYPSVELRLKRDSSSYREELVKEHGKPFLVSDYMKLDLYADSKINIWVKDDIINEEALLIKICEALSKASRTKKHK